MGCLRQTICPITVAVGRRRAHQRLAQPLGQRLGDPAQETPGPRGLGCRQGPRRTAAAEARQPQLLNSPVRRLHIVTQRPFAFRDRQDGRKFEISNRRRISFCWPLGSRPTRLALPSRIFLLTSSGSGTLAKTIAPTLAAVRIVRSPQSKKRPQKPAFTVTSWTPRWALP